MKHQLFEKPTFLPEFYSSETEKVECSETCALGVRVCAVVCKIVKFRVTKTITERWLALEDEDDNGGDEEKEEEEDIEFDDEPLEEIYDIF